MRVFLVWLRKEAHEHAARTRLLFLAIPVLTLLAGWLAWSVLEIGDARELAFGLAAGAVVLQGLVVSSGLFAAETSGPASAPVQRLPGALGNALAAKAGVWGITAVAAALVGVLSTAGVLWLVGQPERAWQVLTPWDAMRGAQQASFLGEGLVYSACLALAGACVRHPGAAVAAGTVLFGVLLGPVLMAHRADARVFPLDAAQALHLEGGALALLACGVAVGWLRGRRRIATPGRAAAWAGAVLVALYGTAAVHAGTSLRDAARLEPHDPGYRIDWAYVGADSRVAFAEVSRRLSAWPRPASGSDDATARELRVIDLATGGWQRVGRRQASFWPLPHGLMHRVPLPALHGYQHMTLLQGQDRANAFAMPAEVLWLDGRTGVVVHSELDGYPDVRGIALQREMLRDLSGVRDEQGRRTWLLDGFLEREGDSASMGVPQAARNRFAFPVLWGPGCWLTTWAPGQSGPGRRAAFAVVDVDRGTVREAPNEEFQPCFPLAPDRLLVTRQQPGGRAGPAWAVLDLGTGTLTPARNPPERVRHLGWPLAVVGRGRVLATRVADGAARLIVWEPESGAQSDVPTDRGLPPFDAVGLTGPDTRGRFVLRLGEAWAWLDAEASRVRLLAHAGVVEGGEALVLEASGAVVFLENKRRIVRVGPEAGRREVLFPRRAGKE